MDPSTGGESFPNPTGYPILAERYQLVSLIGEGGFGWVWQGFDTVLKRPVAIKIPRPGRHILDEARRMAQLHHQGIVAVHNVGEEEEQFIVSDLVNGTDLSRHLLSGPFSAQAALRVAAEVAEALHHAHQHGIKSHRDVKPANILLDGDGKALLTDFGIAATAEELKLQGGNRCGTPAYMSPEQVSGGEVDSRTDIYSLGVVLYELLTGERPYRGNSRDALRDAILNGTPRSIRSINPAVPKEAERIVMRCLAKSQAERYPTSAELAKDLRRLLARLKRRRLSLSVTLAAATLLLPAYNLYVLYNHRYFPFLERNEGATYRGITKLYVHRNFKGALSEFTLAESLSQPSPLLCHLKGEAYFRLGSTTTL